LLAESSTAGNDSPAEYGPWLAEYSVDTMAPLGQRRITPAVSTIGRLVASAAW
jgi:hypothetical protein